MFTEYVDALWRIQGRRTLADVTVEEMARATALWCAHRPIDAELAVLTDTHVQDRVAHRLHDYFDAVACGQKTVVQEAERSLSALLTNVARQHVERHIEQAFRTNAYLADFLNRIGPERSAA